MNADVKSAGKKHDKEEVHNQILRKTKSAQLSRPKRDKRIWQHLPSLAIRRH